MAAPDKLHAFLKHHGYSTTVSRDRVFAALSGSEPLTMHDLVQRCADVDRASVYRTIALFERLGIVTRLQTGWKYKLELSGEFHEHHHHATCSKCGKAIVLAEDASLEKLVHRLAAAQRFVLQSHVLELRGLCQDCQSVSKPF